MSNEPRETLPTLMTSLLQQYQTLDRSVDALIHSGLDATDVLSTQMAGIRQTEQKLRPLRDEHQADNKPINPELRCLTDQTVELVKGLMPKLAQLEKATVESASRLFPQIQESVRAVQMQNAYGAKVQR